MVADLEPFKHWHQKLQAEYNFLTKHSTEVQQQLDTLLKENRALVAGVQQVVLLAVGCQLARPFRLLCFILFTAGEKYEISACTLYRKKFFLRFLPLAYALLFMVRISKDTVIYHSFHSKRHLHWYWQN